VIGRWDDDERGRGIADAGVLREGASELLDAFAAAEWVAEEPDLHLLPRIRDWCERDDRLELTGAGGDATGAYVVSVMWRGPARSIGAATAAAFALIGSFAESATYVRQRRDPGALRFEVGTGMLASDSSFEPHGHLVVIEVVGLD
jgi:hypothetical protein